MCPPSADTQLQALRTSIRSNRSGENAVWRIPAAGGTAEHIVDGQAAWESWDGTELFYGRGGALYSRPLRGGPERQIVPSVVNDREFWVWTAQGRAKEIYVGQYDDSGEG